MEKKPILLPMLYLTFLLLFGCAKVDQSIPQSNSLASTTAADRIRTGTVQASIAATKYYVDPSSTAATVNGSITAPFKSISQLSSVSLAAGDSVFFKRGQVFSGALNISKSGTATSPIVYTNYGTGTLPVFNNAFTDIINLNSVKYVVIDGINITDYTMSTTDHSIQANVSYAININSSTNCTITNCSISLVGIGIAITAGSDYTTIKNNSFLNLRMVRNTPTSINANDDYGANGMVIGSSYNNILNNNFTDCWANSYDYGYDGGAVEIFGSTMNNNNIMYNTANNCNGFIEVGSNSSGICDNSLVAYNKVLNCAGTGTFQTAGTFAVKITNFQYFNNDFVETVSQFAKPTYLFYSALKTPPAGMLVLKNNIFWLSTGINIFPSYFNNGTVVHSNNIYQLQSGTVGLSANTTNLTGASIPLFVSTVGSPINWNYNLMVGSPAIQFGTYVGINYDFNGKAISGNPNAGIM